MHAPLLFDIILCYHVCDPRGMSMNSSARPASWEQQEEINTGYIVLGVCTAFTWMHDGIEEGREGVWTDAAVPPPTLHSLRFQGRRRRSEKTEFRGDQLIEYLQQHQIRDDPSTYILCLLSSLYCFSLLLQRPKANIHLFTVTRSSQTLRSSLEMIRYPCMQVYYNYCLLGRG